MKYFWSLIILIIFKNFLYAQWSTNPYENLEIANHGGNICAIHDGKGGVAITFNNFDYEEITSYLQWVNEYGYKKWAEAKIIADTPGVKNYSYGIFNDNNGSLVNGFFSGYTEYHSGEIYYFFNPYVQKIDSNGNKLWGNGIQLNSDSIGKEISEINFRSDEEGGIYGLWYFTINNYNGTWTDSLIIQHVSKDGQKLFGENGLLITERISPVSGLSKISVIPIDSEIFIINYSEKIEKYDINGLMKWSYDAENYKEIITDGEGGIIASWVEPVWPCQLRINRISSEGVKLWGENGILVDNVKEPYSYALLCLNTDSTVSVFWDTEFYPTDDIFLQRYNLNGAMVWNQHLKISDFDSQKGRAGILNSNNNSNLIVWGEYRDTTAHYAQKIDEDGNKLWLEDKVITFDYATDETKVITDNNDGAIIIWRVNPPWGGIYAQQISKNGNLGEVVPVELLSFVAEVKQNSITLRWSTATETNNKGFEIERVYNNKEWLNISFIEGKGTTTEKQNYTITDENLSTGTYKYRLKQIDYDGTFEYSEEIEVTINIPFEYSLSQNFPNPFNPITKIKYTIAEHGNVLLKVFDILGNEVSVLVNKEQESGEYEVDFYAGSLASGIYFYQLKAGEFRETRKMVVVR